MPASTTYTPIATITLGSAGNFDFSNIPALYTDLVLVMNLRSNAAATTDTISLRLNNDSGSNYANVWLTTNGSSVTSDRESTSLWRFGSFIPGANATSNIFASVTINLFSYSNTSFWKGGMSRNFSPAVGTTTAFHTWRSLSAINQINVGCGTGSPVAGSTATLYGITTA